MPFFREEDMQKIRFLHFSIKKLEEKLKNNENFTIDELNNVLDYSKFLNLNYGKYSHSKIIEELDITREYIDSITDKSIQIEDLHFECARTLAVLARGYDMLSQIREEKEFYEDAIVAMYESSKMYKTAAYFSAAALNQKNKGETLYPLNLEVRSEEARLYAQSIAASNEELLGNLHLASKLYSGLGALAKRIFYLKQHEEIKKHQLRAQLHFDLGKACKLAVDSLEDIEQNEQKISKLKQKAKFYFTKAKDIWENMIKNIPDLSKGEIESIKLNLSVSDDILKNLKTKDLPYDKIKKIQDPEPIIIIPENLAPFVPKATIYLSRIIPKDLNVARFNKFKDKKVEKKTSYSELDKMESEKFAIQRTLLELKKMRRDKEINVEEYTEQYQKYTQKLSEIETKINNLK